MKSKLLIIAAIGAAALSANAATISWGTATNIVDSNDVMTGGGFTYSGANFGLISGTNTVVNGVTFASMLPAESISLGGGVNLAATVGGSFTNNAAAPLTATGTYDTILSTQMGSFSNSLTLNLTGLTIGNQYKVQLFASGGDTQTVNITGGVGLAVAGGNNANNAGTGQYSIGTFTADATSQNIGITGTSGEPVINAMAFAAAVPEPSSAALLGLGGLALLVRRRRRN